MRMGPEQPRAFRANGPVAKRCAFGGAANDADVLRHDLLIPFQPTSAALALLIMEPQTWSKISTNARSATDMGR